MTTSILRLGLCLLALGLLCSATVSASVITYSDLTDFVNDTSATLHPFAAGLFLDVGESLISSGVTYTPISPAFRIGTSAHPNMGFTPQLGLSGPEDMDVKFASAFDFGFSIFQPTDESLCGAVCVEDTFTVTLFNGSSSVGSFTFNPADDVAEFHGYVSTVAFNRAAIRDLTGNIDNEFFGTFFTGESPSVPGTVPEPASMVLAATGLGGGLLRRIRGRARRS